MAKTYLLIGGNLGNRQHNIEKAVELIQNDAGKLIAQSAIYETAPWGFEHPVHFYNQALEVETTLLPVVLLEVIQRIEKTLGRKKTENGHYAGRTMDIDILFYGGEIIKMPGLEIPHKALHKRRFVLIPLSEIAPDYIHPVFNKTIQKLLQECNDNGMVKRL